MTLPLIEFTFRKMGSKDSLSEYYLMSAPQKVHGPLLYHHGVPGKLLIGDLPDFGKFDLQIVSLNPAIKPPLIALLLAITLTAILPSRWNNSKS